MVMADRPLLEFCPIEWARMEGRSVLQWDKDDCAAAGLVKFDLLGLGMLTMLHLAVDLVREYEGVDIDLATIPQEKEVYDLLCAADTSACSRSRAAPRWPRCHACDPATSTTSWSKSR
jgi:error-prone DNA polymerase